MKVDYALFTDTIRNAVSALDVATDFGLEVGRDNRCQCIFCSGDRKDTLRLYPGNKGFFCFRCHKSGDVIKLYQELTGVGFREAIESLNDRYALGLPLHSTDDRAIQQAKERAEERKREQQKKETRQRWLLNALWDVSDAVYLLERLRTETAPETTSEPWKQRFVVSLRYLDILKDERDRLFDELYGTF